MADDNVGLVKSAYEAFGRGDVPAVLATFTDDIEWYEAEGMPQGGLHRGPQEVAEKVFALITQDIEGFSVVPEEIHEAGDTVLVITRYSGTGKSTGNDLDLQVAHVWDVRDGKLARFRQFIDTAMYLEVVPLEVATTA